MRHRTVVSFLLFVALLSVAAPVFASNPVIAGQVSGVELCPQSICGSAIFSGAFQGTVGTKTTKGVFSVSVKHEDLPQDIGDTAAITEGSWFIRTRGNVFYGVVTAGTITKTGDKTFAVTASLEITHGGSGTLQFSGVLDHEDFPPTIVGTISQ